jgi:hypothetical protein
MNGRLKGTSGEEYDALFKVDVGEFNRDGA